MTKKDLLVMLEIASLPIAIYISFIICAIFG